MKRKHWSPDSRGTDSPVHFATTTDSPQSPVHSVITTDSPAHSAITTDSPAHSALTTVSEDSVTSVECLKIFATNVNTFVTLSTVLWGSDSTYKYLSAFKRWVEMSVFFPVQDVSVKVSVGEWTSPMATKLSSECGECLKCFRDSQIEDVVVAVSWRDIESFNLKSIVSCRFFMRQEY